MALVKCKECGSQVSTSAKACPGCGSAPPKRTKPLHIVFAGAVLMMIFYSITREPRSAPPPTPQQVEAKKAAVAIAVAQSAIQGALKDPDSAKFSGAFYKEGTVCGYVNAKNSFGGYSGDKGFVVDEKRGIAELEGSTANFHKRWSERCATP